MPCYLLFRSPRSMGVQAWQAYPIRHRASYRPHQLTGEEQSRMHSTTLPQTTTSACQSIFRYEIALQSPTSIVRSWRPGSRSCGYNNSRSRFALKYGTLNMLSSRAKHELRPPGKDVTWLREALTL